MTRWQKFENGRGLNTNTEITTKECDATIDDLSTFFEIPMKDETANYHNTVSHHAKENNDAVLILLKKTMLL